MVPSTPSSPRSAGTSRRGGFSTECRTVQSLRLETSVPVGRRGASSRPGSSRLSSAHGGGGGGGGLVCGGGGGGGGGADVVYDVRVCPCTPTVMQLIKKASTNVLASSAGLSSRHPLRL